MKIDHQENCEYRLIVINIVNFSSLKIEGILFQELPT